MNRRRYLQAAGLGGLLSTAGCVGGSTDWAGGSDPARDGSDAAGAAVAGERLTLATATTAHDSGLLDALAPGFEELFGASVDTVVRGTGGALETARNGDCDVVLVHARPLEDAFLENGYGVNRRTVMVNDFLVVGPPDDPADAAGQDPLAALRSIAEANAPFLSRGDRSGTHIRERRLWAEADIDPAGSWYSETGQGMGRTLIMAEQADAYTLSDRGTFLTVIENGSDLAAHVETGLADPPTLLRNEYAVIPVNPARHDVAYPLALAFVGYLTGPGQSRIGSFRVDGERAFRPLGPSADPNFEQYVPTEWAD